MIEIKGLNKYYNYKKSNEFHAIKDLSISICDGEFVAIIGTSGSGKSTLLHIIGGLDVFQAGSVSVEGCNLEKMSQLKIAEYRNKTVGVVLQDFALIEGISVIENVMIPLDISGGLSRKTKRKMAMEALQKIGIDDLAKKLTNNLSGGQKQRVAIARAIVNNPSLLLADEPTGALDSTNTDIIMDVFKKLNEEGKTVIMVTHDSHVAEYASKIIELCDGRVK